MGTYLRPTTVEEAIDALATGGARTIVAGATDFYPARVGRPVDEDILDVSAIAGLRAVTQVDGAWRIPALATWTDLIRAELPPAFDGLKAAARTIGGVQIQHRGTLVGNLCNASPAADGLPNLLALGAEVEIASPRGIRREPVATFVTGNRRTTLRPGELVTAIVVPPGLPTRSRSAFRKLGARAYLVISIVSVATVIGVGDDGTISTARIVVGACSEVPQRLPGAEGRLVGRVPGPDLVDAIDDADLAPLAPIDDVRATAAYRRSAALTLVRRAVREVLA